MLSYGLSYCNVEPFAYALPNVPSATVAKKLPTTADLKKTIKVVSWADFKKTIKVLSWVCVKLNAGLAALTACLLVCWDMVQLYNALIVDTQLALPAASRRSTSAAAATARSVEWLITGSSVCIPVCRALIRHAFESAFLHPPC
jgi:hypothetical protein